MYHVGGNVYELVKDNKNGWNYEKFRERYSEVLDRYDYIVGDWGYNQLRLRGFFKENHPKANKDTSIHVLQDYLNEYCNFGCAYFVVEKIHSTGEGPADHRGQGQRRASESPNDERPHQARHRMSHRKDRRSGGGHPADKKNR